MKTEKQFIKQMAFTECTGCVSMNIAPDCSNPRIRGFENVALLICRKDIDFANTVISATSNQISKLTLKTGAKTTVIYNPKGEAFETTISTYDAATRTWTKTVGFYAENIGGVASQQVYEALAGGNYIAIIPRKDHRGDGSFIVFGWDRGLQLATDEWSEASGEGRDLITMTEVETPKKEWVLFDTDFATTLSDFETLKSQSN